MKYIKRTMEKWQSMSINVKVSTAYAVCSILQRCLSFITIPLFTRLLTTQQYGQFTVYSSWSGIITIFITLNLAYGSFSTAMVKFEEKREEYIASIQGICLVLAGLFFLIYFPFCGKWNDFFELPTYLVVALVFEILAQNSLHLWSGKKRFEYKYKSVVGVTLLISFASPLLAFIFVVSSEDKGVARIFGYVIVNVLVGGSLFVYNQLKGKHLYNREFWRYALSFNIPLIAYYLSQVIFNQSDRIMISKITGTSDAAMYGVAYNLAMILTFILNAINNSYVPWFYEKLKKGRQKENRMISCGVALIMSILLLGVIWYAPEIIGIMAGKKYTAAVGVVAPVSASLLLLMYSQFFINVEFYFEEKKLLVYASVGAAAANIILNKLFIPVFGFVAAGYTTLVSYILFAVSNCITMKHVLRKRGIEDDLYSYGGLTVLFAVFIAAAVLGIALYNYLALRIIITAAVLAVLYIKRSIVFDLFILMKNK